MQSHGKNAATCTSIDNTVHSAIFYELTLIACAFRNPHLQDVAAVGNSFRLSERFLFLQQQ